MVPVHSHVRLVQRCKENRIIDGRECAVLLLDTEGLYDTERDGDSDRCDLGLMLFAMLLSSYFIYNTTSVINSQSIDQLESALLNCSPHCVCSHRVCLSALAVLLPSWLP